MSTPSWVIQAAAAVLALQRLQARSSQNAQQATSKLWQALGPVGLWNDGLAAGVAAREAMLDMALVEGMRRAGWSYGKSVVRSMGGAPARGLEPWLPTRLNTDPFATAMRVADGYRHKGTLNTTVRPDSFTADDGGAQAREWLSSMLSNDWARLDRDASQASEASAVRQYERSGYHTYMRVPHPAASKSGTCGLCIAASTRTYSTSNLSPLHDHCHCTVVPAFMSGRRADRHGGGGLPATTSADFNDLSNVEAQTLRRIYMAANRDGSDNAPTRSGLSNVHMDANGNISVNGKPVANVGVNSEVGPVFASPGSKTTGNWHVPNADDAEQQLRLIMSRSGKLDDLFDRAIDGHHAEADIFGRRWIFDPIKGLQEAKHSNDLLAQIAQKRLLQLS